MPFLQIKNLFKISHHDSSKVMEICDLPVELLEHILSFLSVVCELQTASQVCRLWKKLCLSIYSYKNDLFLEEAQKGNFVWRNCGGLTQVRSLHFVPKHVKPRGPPPQLCIPSPRSFHHAVPHGQYIYVYGGESGGTALSSSSYFNDMFRYDVLNDKWSKVSTTGTPPTPRSKVSVTKFNDTLIVTGGCVATRARTSIRPAEVIHNDVHFFDMIKCVWYKGGSLLSGRCYHESVCLGNSDSPKLILTGGFTSMVQMCDAIEVCNITKTDDETLTISGSKRFPIRDTRIFHSLVKLDERTIFLYGGMTQAPDQPSQHFIRTDACLVKFDPSFTYHEITEIAVNCGNVYNGLYPSFLNDFVRVGNSLIYFQRSGFIKPIIVPEAQHTTFYEADTERKPTGDEIYRQDYYHTFILNLDGVCENQSVSWMPVTKNPPLLAPRHSIFHRTVLVGDGIYVFGGTVLDQRNKQPKSSNNLYKISVLKSAR